MEQENTYSVVNLTTGLVVHTGSIDEAMSFLIAVAPSPAKDHYFMVCQNSKLINREEKDND